MIEFLLSKNSWYRSADIFLSDENLSALYENEQELDNGCAIPAAIDLCCIPECSGSLDIDHIENPHEQNGANLSENSEGQHITMESVGYTEGDFTPKNYRQMKATALSWCLDGKQFIKSTAGSQLICDRDEGLLTFLFPHLDPWGIGNFCARDHRQDQKISFERHVCNLLLQVNSPFQKDSSFAYICWNILQKREVSRQATFRTNAHSHSLLAQELKQTAPDLTGMIAKWEKNPEAKPTTTGEKKAVHLLGQLKLVAKEIRGSSGYKQCRRNEIRALMNKFCTPALFITINPADIYNPMLAVMAGMDPKEWQKKSIHERACFVAQNPGPAARFFDLNIRTFIEVILRYGDLEGGLFGHCSAYYAMVEAQGRGTLHCHMLVWLKGNPSPQQLRDQMIESTDFRTTMFKWLESIIFCELPGTTEPIKEENNIALERPVLSSGSNHP